MTTAPKFQHNGSAETSSVTDVFFSVRRAKLRSQMPPPRGATVSLGRRRSAGGAALHARSGHQHGGYKYGDVVKSLFILWITGPRSSVRPSLTRAWWLSATGYVAVLEPPPAPGEVAASGLGASPGIAPGLASHTATARSPGRQPFWPTQSHLLHHMALQWPERAERALSIPYPTNELGHVTA